MITTKGLRDYLVHLVYNELKCVMNNGFNSIPIPL